jgi:hypothetical protein
MGRAVRSYRALYLVICDDAPSGAPASAADEWVEHISETREREDGSDEEGARHVYTAVAARPVDATACPTPPTAMRIHPIQTHATSGRKPTCSLAVSPRTSASTT